MSEMPKGWVNSRLEESIYLNQKLTNIGDDSECGFVPMAMVPTKYGVPIEFEAKTWGMCKKGYTQFQNDDVLLAKITPCFENGKGALVSGLPNGIGAGSTEYFVLRSVGSLVEPKYLHAFVKTRDFLINCETNMSGSVGHRRVPKDYLLHYSMPLAPLAEQKRIVEKLDEVLAQVDTIKARLDGIPDLLKRFRQSVLASAVSGKLTEEWRKKSDMPLGQTKPLKNAGKVIAGQSPSRAEVNSDGYGEPYVTGPEQWDGKKILHHKWTMYPKRMAPDGSIFVTVKGAGVGTTFPGCYAAIGRDVYAFVPSEQMQYKYILYAIQASAQDVVLKAKGLIPGLTKSDIIDHCVYLPRIEEQKEIVRLVDQYFAFADIIEAQVKKAQTRVDNLTQSILAKAFRGELVPQDPNDEPADRLLERIAEARKEAEALAKAAKKAENTKKRAAKKAAENN